MADDRAHKLKENRRRAKLARQHIADLARSLGKDPDHCTLCGKGSRGKGSLHWHHRDPATKLFQIGDTRNYGRSDVEKLAELAKCERICKTCHYYHHSTATNKVEDRGRSGGWAVNMNFPTEKEADIAHKTLEALRREFHALG